MVVFHGFPAVVRRLEVMPAPNGEISGASPDQTENFRYPNNHPAFFGKCIYIYINMYMIIVIINVIVIIIIIVTIIITVVINISDVYTMYIQLSIRI